MPNRHQCPLCMQNNACAQVKGQPAQECWCMSTEFPPAEFMTEVQTSDSCLCSACVARLLKLSKLKPKQVD